MLTDEDTVDSVNILAPVFNGDHCVLGVSLKLHSVPFKRKVWNYEAAGWDSFRTSLEKVDWHQCFIHDDIGRVWESWLKIFTFVMKTHIPNKEVTVRPWDKSWYNNNLRREKRKLKRIHKLARRVNTIEL